MACKTLGPAGSGAADAGGRVCYLRGDIWTHIHENVLPLLRAAGANRRDIMVRRHAESRSTIATDVRCKARHRVPLQHTAAQQHLACNAGSPDTSCSSDAQLLTHAGLTCNGRWSTRGCTFLKRTKMTSRRWCTTGIRPRWSCRSLFGRTPPRSTSTRCALPARFCSIKLVQDRIDTPPVGDGAQRFAAILSCLDSVVAAWPVFLVRHVQYLHLVTVSCGCCRTMASGRPAASLPSRAPPFQYTPACKRPSCAGSPCTGSSLQSCFREQLLRGRRRDRKQQRLWPCK